MQKLHQLKLAVTLRLTLLVWALYVISAYLGLQMAVPPGYATAIWAPSGIALGAVLIWGWRLLPAVFLGSFTINLYLTFLSNASVFSLMSLNLAAWIGVGATLQAIGGRYLIKVFLGLSSRLDQVKDILIFALLSGPVACLINASWSTSALVLFEVLPIHFFLLNWTTWWIGDSIGVLIFTPFFLILFAEPRIEWQDRLLPILFPLTVCFLIVLVVAHLVMRVELNRVNVAFSQVTNRHLNQVVNELSSDLLLAQALRDYLSVAPDINKETFSEYGKLLLANSQTNAIQAVQWVPKVMSANSFEEKFNQIYPDYKFIKDFHGNRRVVSDDKTIYYPIYFIEPLNANQKILGFDLGSDATRISLLEKVARENKILLSGPLSLIQNPPTDQGFILVAPLYKNQVLQGFILSALNIKRLLRGIISAEKDYSSINITDVTDPEQAKTVYHYSNTAAGLEKYSVHFEKTVVLAGRSWLIQASSSKMYINEHYSWQVWIALASSLLLCALINIILFIIYAQNALIKLQVREKTEELQDSEVRNLLLLQSTIDGIYGLNKRAEVTFVNKAACRLLGYREDELLGKNMHKIIQHSYADGKSYPIEKCPVETTIKENRIVHLKNEALWRKDGTYFWAEYTSTPLLKENKVIGAMVVFHDITKARAAEKKLYDMVHNDFLTQIPNRLSFMEKLQKNMERANQEGTLFAVCFIDLDNFKQINDYLGHTVGDKLLKLIPSVLKPLLQEGDYLARLGGDEFGLLITSCKSQAEIEKRVILYLTAFHTTFEIEHLKIKVFASMGVSIFPDIGVMTAEALIRHADIAVYRAKELGKNQYVFFDKTLHGIIQRRHQIEVNLKLALEKNEFNLVYQAEIKADSEKLAGMEVLLRWKNSSLGDVSPSEFIPIAEETGLIHAIGRWVLEKACLDYRIIVDKLKREDLILSVNASLKELEHEDYSESIKSILVKTKMKPSALVLELTESAFMKRPEATIQLMKNLIDLGVRFSLDDFGTGYSSMRYLKDLAISILKIDKSFIDNMTTKERDATIVKTIIRLAHGLDLQIIAEGVETRDQLLFLKAQDCEQIQGDYFAKPMSLENFIAHFSRLK